MVLSRSLGLGALRVLALGAVQGRGPFKDLMKGIYIFEHLNKVLLKPTLKVLDEARSKGNARQARDLE